MARRNTAKLTVDTAATSVGFQVRQWGGIRKVIGRFADFDIEVEFDEANPESSRIELRASGGSVTTGSYMRDKHLRSSDFFDAENHPRITFSSRRVDAYESGRFGVEGMLTVCGVTRAVGLVARLSDPGEGHSSARYHFVAAGTVKRKDFGLDWNFPIVKHFMPDFAIAPDAQIRVEGYLV